MRELYNLDLVQIENLIKSRHLTISVIGTGRIGLTTAVMFAHKGFETIGVDINQNLVKLINSGKWPLKDEPGFESHFEDAIKKTKLLRATTDITDAVPRANVVILSLPTPMDENQTPDYSALEIVGKSLHNLLEPYSVLVVESTVEPGFIEDKLIKIIEGDGRRIKFGKNAGIAACPETANPGVIFKDYKKVPRLVGAIDTKTRKIASALYGGVFEVELVELSDCKTANAAKLTANVFRDINIAFVNELSLLYEKLGIDILEVLQACDKKYNFETHYPGAGVGGPCLPVNSYQMLHSSNGSSRFLKIIKAARETNEYMPYHTVDLLGDGLNEAGKSIKNSMISILGVSYKPDVKDAQNSPAHLIVDELTRLGGKIRIYDPYFKSSEVFAHSTEASLLDAVKGADAVIIATGHQEFRNIDPNWLVATMTNDEKKSSVSQPVLIDGRGIFDRRVAKKAGLIFRGIGRI